MAGRGMFSPFNYRSNLYGGYPSDGRSHRHRGMSGHSRGYAYDPYPSYYNDYVCDDCYDREYYGAQLPYFGSHNMICDDPGCSQYEIVMYDPGYSAFVPGQGYGGGNYFGRGGRGMGGFANKYAGGMLGGGRSMSRLDGLRGTRSMGNALTIRGINV